MKIIKKDYPWTIIAESKIGKQSLKPYIDIAIGFTERDIKATSEGEKYKTTWVHTLDKRNLLKGASALENVYQSIADEEDKEREREKQAQKAPEPKTVGDILDAMPDDEIPFGA